jgi:phosphatidate cytidylyltransferase
MTTLLRLLPTLHDPILLAYARAVAVVLAGSGLVLALLSRGLGKDLRSIWATWRAWLVMGPLFLAAAALGRPGLVVLFTGLSLLGMKEFARATGLYRDWAMVGTAYAGIVAVAVLCGTLDPVRGTRGWYGLFMALPVFATSAMLLVPIVRNRVKGQLQAMSLGILGFVYLGWMFGHLSFLATYPRALGHILFLVFAVELNDVSAFTFGRLLGRHPLRSVISPKKTWEGALGALAVSMALPWLLRFSFPHFTPVQLLLTGLIVGVGGQLGDLSISVIKRDIGIKDMGAAIPGHGGVLDRIDSLIYVAPLFLHMVRYTRGV